LAWETEQCNVSFQLEFQIDLGTLVPFVPWHPLGLAFQWMFQSSLSTESLCLAHCSSICHITVVSTRDALAAQQPPTAWMKPLPVQGHCDSSNLSARFSALCTYARYLAVHNEVESLPVFCSQLW